MASERSSRNPQDNQDLNRLKSDFLNKISHELRTPLNGILGMAHLLQETPLNPEQQHFLELLVHSAERQLKLVTDLLNFNLLERRSLEQETEACRLPRLLADLVKPFQARADRKRLDFSIHLDPALPLWVRTDKYMVKQILTNLLDNAIKFTAQGGLALWVVKGASTSEDLVEIHFSVEDTGPGIPEQSRMSIYESFRQEESSLSRTHEGAGLGLSIVQKLLQILGSQLHLDSTPGEGSTFSFILSVETCPEQGDSQKPSQQSLGDILWDILLVEDDESNQVYVQRLLGKKGHRLEVVSNGELALEALKSGKSYDLVLMDISMPVLDGLECTRLIRQAPEIPGGQDLPIIALTGHAMAGDRERCLAAGMDGYLSKPLLLDLVLSEIHRVMILRQKP